MSDRIEELAERLEFSAGYGGDNADLKREVAQGLREMRDALANIAGIDEWYDTSGAREIARQTLKRWL